MSFVIGARVQITCGLFAGGTGTVAGFAANGDVIVRSDGGATTNIEARCVHSIDDGGASVMSAAATRGGPEPPPPTFAPGMRVRNCSSGSVCTIATVLQILPGGGALRLHEETPEGPRIRDVSVRLLKPLE